MARGTRWSRDELLLAFGLYHRLPFGKLHQHNPQIITLAETLQRTPSSIAMKLVNFASLDPIQQARDIRGLGNVAKADRQLWQEFDENSEAVAAAAAETHARIAHAEEYGESDDPAIPAGPTETTAEVRVRRVQGFFRSAVLASYDFRCALSDIAIPELLNASHIIPWSESIERRAHPTNGLCLNALYDRAFDRGLITLNDDLQVMVSPALHIDDPGDLHREALLTLEGRPLRIPKRSAPDLAAIAYHREHRFRAAS